LVGQTLLETLCVLTGSISAAQRRQDRELVAADPGDPFLGTEQPTERVPETDEHQVTLAVPVLRVQLAQPIQVAEQDRERLLRGEPLVHLDLEAAGVRQAGQPVAGHQDLELLDQVAVPCCEPADERTSERVSEQADRRAHGQEVDRRERGVDGHRDGVEDGRDDPRDRSAPRAAHDRDHRDRHVEEVAQAEAGRLQEHEPEEDQGVRNRSPDEDRATMEVCRSHALRVSRNVVLFVSLGRVTSQQQV
jgi:hypothetical protein